MSGEVRLSEAERSELAKVWYTRKAIETVERILAARLSAVPVPSETGLATAEMLDAEVAAEIERLGGKEVVSANGMLNNWIGGLATAARLVRDSHAHAGQAAAVEALAEKVWDALDTQHDSKAYHVHAAECCWPFVGAQQAITAALLSERTATTGGGGA